MSRLVRIGICKDYVVIFFLMIRRPPRSTLFPYRRSSDLRGLIPWVKKNNNLDRKIFWALQGIDFKVKQGEVRSEEHTSELQSH